ncbi:MAG: hypothetical protein MUE96_09490 [Bacteroidia bacterium]|nr:hypothetical protein [Bacteroidia bacterium]
MTLILIGLLCVQLSCLEDKDAPCRNAIIADSILLPNNIAYSNTDTLLFTTANNNDSIWLLTKQNNLTAVLVRGNTPNNPDCLNDYIAYTERYIVLRDSVLNIELTVSASRYTDSTRITVANNQLQIGVNAIGQRDSTYSDSLMLGNQMYYKVNRFVSEGGTLFYVNSTQGLLQFEWQQQVYFLRE